MVDSVERRPGHAPDAEVAVAKRLLAFDALSSLTHEFARHPDVHRLLEVAMLTLSGQFAVTGSFVIIVSPGGDGERVLTRATGRFANHPMLNRMARALDGLRLMFDDGEPHTIAELRTLHVNPDFVNTLETAGVRVMVPLLHEGGLVGLIGLGPRIADRTYEDSDIGLLSILASTVTPLLINSVLFADLAKLKSWYLDILNSVKQCVFVFDCEYSLKKVNHAAATLLNSAYGEKAGAVPLTGAVISEVFSQDTFPGWSHKLMFATPHASDGMVDPLRVRLGGEERIFQARVTYAAGAHRSHDVIVTMDDITGQTEQEQRLFELQRFAEQGMMASSIAHELNNFLALIVAGTEMAHLALNRGDQVHVAKSLGRIKESASRMARFTSGLTDFSRQRRQMREGQLNDVVTDVLSFVVVQRRFKGIELDSDLDASLPAFRFDPDQLVQVLLNLMNNAADAIAEGKTEDGRITVATKADRSHVMLEVSDNGPGIPEANRDLLFKERHTTKEKGHGYGLVTCSKIIAEHGGTILLDVANKHRTTFRVNLPLAVEADKS